jgi:hypothetical protein
MTLMEGRHPATRVVESAAKRGTFPATPQTLADARAAALHKQPQHDDEQNASDDANDGRSIHVSFSFLLID